MMSIINLLYVGNVAYVEVDNMGKDRINIDPVDSEVKKEFKKLIVDKELGTYGKGLEYLLKKVKEAGC